MLVFICFATLAQETTKLSIYDPSDLFAPLEYPTGDNNCRTVTGAPGTLYWQNKVDYVINARLDESINQITGVVTIKYKNNSPHDLSYLWLQLDQNLFNKNSRGQARMPANSYSRYGDSKSNFNGGYQIKNVQEISNATNSKEANFLITDTRMQIRLA